MYFVFIFYVTILLLTCLLSYLLHAAESSWEANRSSASQEIPRILWTSKVHYRTHKCPPPVPLLSQLDPDHTSSTHFLKIHLNIILSSRSGSPKWSLSFRFTHQNPVYASPLPHTCYMPRPFYFSRFNRKYWSKIGSTLHFLLVSLFFTLIRVSAGWSVQCRARLFSQNMTQQMLGDGCTAVTVLYMNLYR